MEENLDYPIREIPDLPLEESTEEEIVKKIEQAQELTKKVRIPKLTVLKWVRFPQTLDFSQPFRAVIMGTTGSGKSALVETLATKSDQYNNGEGKIIDIFASRDLENLAWCRHEQYKDDVLLIHGNDVKLSCEWHTKKIGDMTLKDYQEHKVILSVPVFYSSLEDEWKSIAKMTGILQQRTSYDRHKVWFVAVREGSSLLYSRIGVGDSQGVAKNKFVYAIREFRHSGCAIGVDILRFTGLDVEVRSLADFLFLKAHGLEGLADELRWVYAYYDLFVDIMRQPEWAFIIATKKGGLGHGNFQLPYIHKGTHEDFLTLFNIEIKYGDKINYADKGNNHTSDFEHVDIMKVRIAKGIGTAAIAKGGTFDIDGKTMTLQKRSGRTVYQQILKHNQDIDTSGSCHICKRLDQQEQSTTRDPAVNS